MGAGAVVIVGAKKIAGSPERKVISLPAIPVEQTLESLGEDVLGGVAENLPGVLGIKKKVNQGETEPIEKPVENVQNQTQQLLESIKKLPQDQLEAIKKQLFKEFCEQLR